VKYGISFQATIDNFRRQQFPYHFSCFTYVCMYELFQHFETIPTKSRRRQVVKAEIILTFVVVYSPAYLACSSFFFAGGNRK